MREALNAEVHSARNHGIYLKMRSFARRWQAVLATATLAVRLLAPDVGHQCASDLDRTTDAAASSSASVTTDGAANGTAHTAAHMPAAHVHTGHEHAQPAASAPHADLQSDLHADHGASDTDTQPGAPAHDCDCETTCCCVATAATRVDPCRHQFASFTLSRTLAISAANQWVAAWIDHVLPFTTPPPVTTLG